MSLSQSEKLRRREIQIEGAWIKRIEKGDVLRSRSGKLRVVRAVKHAGPSIPKTYLTFVIGRCSWTTRPYTVLTGNDLRQMGYSPTDAKVKLRQKFDKLIQEDFMAPRAELCNFRCCDVVGIA